MSVKNDPILRETLEKKIDTFQKVLSRLSPKPDTNVLDIGCGPKANRGRAYAAKGCNVTAIDADRDIVAAAREACSDISMEFKVIEVGSPLPFESQSFDIVICWAALHHMPDKQVLFKDVNRVLKPRGYFHLADPIVSEELHTVWTILSRLREADHYSYCTFLELTNLIEDNGFRVECMYPFLFPRKVDDWINSDIIDKNSDGKEIAGSYALYSRNKIKEIMLEFMPQRLRDELHFRKDEKDDWWFSYNALEIALEKIIDI